MRVKSKKGPGRPPTGPTIAVNADISPAHKQKLNKYKAETRLTWREIFEAMIDKFFGK